MFKSSKHMNQSGSLKRGNPLVMLIATMIIFVAASLPISAPAAAEFQHNRMINSESYKKKNGSWEILKIPSDDHINTIHASLLPTGKILLVAGSGNNEQTFDKYYDDGMISVLKTVLYDPTKNTYKLVSTPSDLFCSGHAMLQNGQLLIAGGTSGYETMASMVMKPAGTMILHNEDSHSAPLLLKKGTKFIASDGKAYASKQDITIQPATKIDRGNGNVTTVHSTTKVFVEAVKEDSAYATTTNQHYTIQGLTGDDAHNIYGQGGPMTYDKQDYRGDDKAYQFDPIKEEYVQVGNMNESRWYASLPVLQDGRVLAVSGLDNTGQITDTSEYYDSNTKSWTWGPTREFPTYPALFRTQNANMLFFTGSTAGYGPADKDREPGFWNLDNSSFSPVSGLRNNQILETSGSVALPPNPGSNDGSQSWKIMIAGGGGIGESPLSTARTDIIDLNTKDPHYTPGPNLPEPLRYINLTVTPWDSVIASGGSSNYRGKGNSYSHSTFAMDPQTKNITPLADELVGRSYHSGSLLLPDGRIMVFGNDPLYGDKKDTQSGTFEQRIEIYTPPQLYAGQRPTLDGPTTITAGRGDTLTFNSTNASTIKTARLIPPSSTTHVTNIEQRSVAAVVKTEGSKVTVSLPKDENLLTNGYYMLFVTNGDGTPSYAKMVDITR
jgi:hypothetical protein